MRIRHYIKRVLAASLAFSFALHSLATNAAGIPVVDVASISDRALKHAQTLAKYIEQITVMKNQLDSQRRQLESLTGSRNLGEILNNPAIRDALPESAHQVLRMANATNGDLGEILRRIEREERLTGNYSTDRKNLDSRSENLAFRSQALMERAQKAMTARMKQLDNLQRQINQTQDPKAIADLQARLLVEQANIQVDQTRMVLLKAQLDAEQDLIEAQSEKLTASSFSVDAIGAPIRRAR